MRDDDPRQVRRDCADDEQSLGVVEPPGWSDGWVTPMRSCPHDGARLVWIDGWGRHVMVCSKSGWEADACAKRSRA